MTVLSTARRRLGPRALAIAQTGAAALAAWYVSVLLLADPQPVFAPIAAVIAIGASHGEHRSRAVGLVLGVVLGLALADAIVHLIGSGAPQLALMVVLAMSIATVLGGSELIISEAAVSAMLLIVTGPGHDFSPNRILEAVIGGGVALAVALAFPPDPLLHVGRAAQTVFGELGRTLERIAAALDAGNADAAEAALAQARRIDGRLGELEAALAVGRETARTAPQRFAARAPLERYDRSLEQIDLAVRNTRVLARHGQRALRAGERLPVLLPFAVAELSAAVWRLASAYDEPELAGEARELASSAAGRPLGTHALAENVRSTAVDLMRAAELVAGAPDELPTEELLLAPPPGHDPHVHVG